MILVSLAGRFRVCSFFIICFFCMLSGTLYSESMAVISCSPQWDGYWIWDSSSKYGKCYFRLPFSVPESGVSQIVYQGAGSQKYTLYCNGQKVLRKELEFGSSDCIDLKDYVSSGENVLAAVCESRDYPGGWLAEITSVCPNGNTTIALSDKNTLISLDYQDGWQALHFNDTNWKQAKQLYQPPNGRLEHISKKFVGSKWQVRADRVVLNKQSFCVGDALSLQADLIPKSQAASDLSAYITLMKDGQELLTHNISPEQRTTKWNVGEVHPFRWSIDLSKYLKRGSYTVRAGFYRTDFGQGDSYQERTFTITDQREPLTLPRTSVKVCSGVPQLIINETSNYPVGFLHRPWGVPTATQVSNYRKMADAGAVFFNTPLPVWGMTTGSGFTQPKKWRGDGLYDFSRVDATFLRILDQVPDAYFIPRVPVRAPAWWCDENLDEMCRYVDDVGWVPEPYGGTRHESFASEKWLTEASRMLEELIRYIHQSPYADRIIGYQLDGGVYGEWHIWSPRHLPDISEPMRRRFADRAKKSYHTIQDVNAAWQTEFESFDEITCPLEAARYASDIGVFRDVSKSSYVTDYWRCLHETTADAILRLAGVVKNATKGNALCGAFYGYLTDSGWAQEGGHLAISSVLKSPNIDFLASPHSYSHRAMGAPGFLRAYPQSVMANGKIFVDEADTRTYLADPSPLRTVKNAEESVQLLKRGFLNALGNNSGLWFFDMSVRKGWFDDPVILKSIRRMTEVCEQIQAKPQIQLPKDVAVICDPWAFTYMADWRADKDKLRFALFNEQMVSFSRMGAPFDIYLLDDVLDGKITHDYKCWIFLNTWHLEQEDIEKIKEQYSAGDTFVYVYAPGFSSMNGLSVDGMESLTGLGISSDTRGGVLESKNGAGATVAGIKTLQAPKFSISGLNGGQVLARYVDTDEIAVAATMQDGAKVVYSAAAPLGIGLLREILDLAGVHRYIETEDCLFVGSGIIGIHASTSGEKSISLPRPYKITDAISQEVLSPKTDTIQFESILGETSIFQIGPVD